LTGSTQSGNTSCLAAQKKCGSRNPMDLVSNIGEKVNGGVAGIDVPA